MRRALSGESGTVIGLDYRGELVLAAYEPVEGLDLGIVAKIDFAEVRAPFVKAGLIAALTSAVIVLAGAVLFLQVTNPLLRHLEESERKYRTLFEFANDSIFIIDPPTGRFLDVNQNAARRLGYTRDELLQLTIGDLYAPEDAGRNKDIIQELQEKGSTVFEHVQQRKDGSSMPIEASSRVIEYGGQQVFQSFVRDITKRKIAEAEREQLIKELDAYAYTVAHDLKSPLSQISGFAELLAQDFDQQTEFGEEQREMVQYIRKSATKMTDIIVSLLLLASVRKTDAVKMSRLDMALVVEEVRQRLAHTINEREAEITVPAGWPDAVGYAPWVEEVWANYLSNALKYGGQPPCVILGADNPNNGRVRFWVEDNGPGLTPEEQAQLFAPFTRLDQMHVDGHGLGLSIVQRIVDRLGGETGVESAPGEGCTFWFTLPRN